MNAWLHGRRMLAAVAAACGVAAAAAASQATASPDAPPQIQPVPSPAAACARTKAGEPEQPEYPFVEFKNGTPGRVQATVTLPGGLLGNGVTIVSSEGGAAFEQEARRWLRSLEAPCLPKGESATLSYDIIFRPDSRQVLWARPRDAAGNRIRELAQCVKHASGAAAPAYPHRARREEIQGRVLAVMAFSGPDSAPQLELFARRAARVLQEDVREWVSGLRMPCHPGEEVIKVSAVYVYRFEGDAYGFKPLTVVDLLGVGKGVLDRPLSLDTTTMGCPFELRLEYFQPMRPNKVGEVGDSDPRRRPLLELLQALELDLPRASLDSVFADTAHVAVPCIRLVHNPQEKKP